MCSKNYINKQKTQIIALNDYGCLVRYTIKSTPVHTDAHDNINLIFVNEIFYSNMILVLEYQCL